jgi:hypothetical protein
MTMPYKHLPTDEVIARLAKEGRAYFSNDSLRLLEEAFRRLRQAEKVAAVMADG